jgi:hypothetical protein
MAAPAGVVKRPDSVAAAADPVSARKLRRDNADMDMLALPQIDFLWTDDAPDAGVPQAADERREAHCAPMSEC